MHGAPTTEVTSPRQSLQQRVPALLCMQSPTTDRNQNVHRGSKARGVLAPERSRESKRETSRDFCSDWTCCGAWDLLLCFGLAALAWTCCSGLELLLCCGLAALAGTCSWEKMSTLNPVLDWCCDWTGCAAGDLLLCCGLASLAWTCFKDKIKFLCEFCLGLLL